MHLSDTERAIADKLFLAYDKPTFEEADRRLLMELRPYFGGVKIGLEAIHAEMRVPTGVLYGECVHVSVASMVRECARKLGYRIFLDAKLKDTPNTMAGAARSIEATNVWGFTIHASSGIESIAEAVQASESALVIGVTVLTSFSDLDCLNTYGESSQDKVVQFAHCLSAFGADAIVCSGLELQTLASHGVFGDLLKIVPGTRLPGDDTSGQTRIVTPGKAVADGADFLVIGRSVTKAKNPQAATHRTIEDILRTTANRSEV